MSWNPSNVPMLIVTWVIFLVSMLFTLAVTLPDIDLGFLTLQGMNDTETEITPSHSTTYSIIGATFLYQLIWLWYATASTFRRRPRGKPLHQVAPFLPLSVYSLYILSNLSHITWHIVVDRGLWALGLVLITLSAFTAFFAAGVAVSGIYTYHPLLVAYGFCYENRYVSGMVCNAFVFYGTWVLFAAHVNVAIVLQKHFDAVSDLIAGSIALAILTAFFIIWAIIDLAFLERHTRFIIAEYVVLIWGLSGVIAQHFNPHNPITVNAMMLLAMSVILLLLKIGVCVVKEIKMPAFEPQVLTKRETWV